MIYVIKNMTTKEIITKGTDIRLESYLEFRCEIKGVIFDTIDRDLNNFKIGFRIDIILTSPQMSISTQCDGTGFPMNNFIVPTLIENEITFKTLSGEMYVDDKHVTNLDPDRQILEINGTVNSIYFHSLIGKKEIEHIEKLIKGKDYLNIKINVKFSYEIRNKKSKEVKENENRLSIEYKFPRCEWKRLTNIDSKVKTKLQENELLYYFYKDIGVSSVDLNTIISKFITKFSEDEIKYVLDSLCDKKYIYRDENKYEIRNNYIKIKKLVTWERFKHWRVENLVKFVKYLQEHPTVILLIMIFIFEIISYYSNDEALFQTLANFTYQHVIP